MFLRKSRRCLGVLLLLCSAPNADVFAERNESIEQCIAALEARQKALKSAAVTIIADHQSYLDQELPPSQYVSEFAWDGDRIRVDHTSQRNNTEGTRFSSRKLAVFNGDKTTSISGNDKRWIDARISKGRVDFPWGTGLIRNTAILHESGTDLLTLLKSDKITVAKADDTRVVLEYRKDEESPTKSQLVFRRDKGFAFAERRQFRLTSDDHWKVTSELVVSEFEEVANDLYVPVAASYHLGGLKESGEYVAVIETNATFSGWELNPELTNDMFQLGLPANVIVTDRITKKTYFTPAR